jgi:hypothetical protein
VKKHIALAGLFLLIFASLSISQPANVYTFSGDVDLGEDFIGFVSSGLHYIASRGDTVYVIWSKGHTYCQKSTDGGQSFGLPVRVNSTPDGVNPSMKLGTADIVYVAFQHYGDIYFSKSLDGGITFISGVKVNDDTIPEIGQQIPGIAVNNKGHIFIVWRDQRTAPGEPHRAVFASASYDGGQTFTPNVQINDSSTVAGNADIAADDSGNVYVAWESFIPPATGIVYLTRSSDSGQTFPWRTLVTDPPGDSTPVDASVPSIAVGNGTLGIAWEDWRYDRFSIRFSVSNDLGQTFSPSLVVDSGSNNLQSPSLFWQNGIFYVVWRAGHPRPSDSVIVDHIYFSYSPNQGQSFVPYVDVITVDTNQAAHNGGSISVNEQGKAFVVWADNRYDPTFQLNWHLFVTVGTPSAMKGDLNLDGVLSPADVVLELNAVFLGLPFPAPFESGDGNCDGRLSSADMILLLNATFTGSPFPCT